MLAHSKVALVLPFEVDRIGCLLQGYYALFNGLGQLGHVCRLRFYHRRDGAPLVQYRLQGAVEIRRLVATCFVEGSAQAHGKAVHRGASVLLVSFPIHLTDYESFLLYY